MILPIIIAIVIISSIAACLAGLLNIAEYFFANYGPCEITINDDRKFTVEGGEKLLSVLINEKIFIPSACGGRGTCGLCKLKILEGGGTLLPTEEPYLEEYERQNNVRISCQVKIREDIKIEIPEELLNIKEYSCKCIEIADLTYDMKLFKFQLLEPDTIDFIAGQYIQLLTPIYEKSGEEVYRAYSVASDATQKNVIELIIRLMPGGICTTYCFEYLKVGDEIKLNGPYGDFRLSETNAPIVFIAGGSGMAPINCLLHQMKNENINRNAVYYFGANTVNDLFYLDEMKQFESQLADFKFVPVVAAADKDDSWDSESGLVTQAVERNLKNADQCEAYLCGSPGMIDASIEVLKKLGMNEKNIFFDKFE
ncbi:MAG: 2Fe-2S iron-sulfur cluster binding domain-containing protein [Planctomycetes bacterium]|nr:2Fe-2S iron-sulfur cluster binding domain-containing protein [Planctomycetota bacterium]